MIKHTYFTRDLLRGLEIPEMRGPIGRLLPCLPVVLAAAMPCAATDTVVLVNGTPKTLLVTPDPSTSFKGLLSATPVRPVLGEPLLAPVPLDFTGAGPVRPLLVPEGAAFRFALLGAPKAKGTVLFWIRELDRPESAEACHPFVVAAESTPGGNRVEFLETGAPLDSPQPRPFKLSWSSDPFSGLPCKVMTIFPNGEPESKAEGEKPEASSRACVIL